MSAWKLGVTGIRQGLVTTVDIVAQRKCGRIEELTAFEFPAGWRLGNAPHVPAAVRSEALRLARTVAP